MLKLVAFVPCCLSKKAIFKTYRIVPVKNNSSMRIMYNQENILLKNILFDIPWLQYGIYQLRKYTGEDAHESILV